MGAYNMRIIDISIKDALMKYEGYVEQQFDSNKTGFVTTCPIHGGDKFYIYNKTLEGKGWDWFCYSCGGTGVGGNLVDLLIKRNICKDAKEATEKIQQDFNLAPPQEWNVNTFAAYKGLDPQLLIDMGWVTEAQGLRVPYYGTDGSVISEKMRPHTKANIKYYYMNGTTSQPYGLNLLPTSTSDTVYITEGETDCLTLIQAGYTAIGIPGCNGWKQEYTSYLSSFEKVIIVKDNDDQGQTLVTTMSVDFPDNLHIIQLPKSIKDINDFHQYACFCNIEDFKVKFNSLTVLPATTTCFIKECTTNKQLVTNKQAWAIVSPQLKNPMVKEEFVSQLHGATKCSKTAINQMIELVNTKQRNLDDWYTVTKTSIELNAEKYAEHLAKTVPLIKVSGMWYLYFTSGVYKMVGEEYVVSIVRKGLIEECSKEPRNIKDTMFYLENNTDLIKDYEEFDVNPYIMNVKNGLLNIKTMSLSEHSPKYLSMKQLNVNYTPSVKESVLFKEYLNTKIDDPETRCLSQEVLGYSISNFYEAEKWILIWGRGRSGKGTFLTIIDAVAGKENVSSIALQNLGDRFNKASLFGKIANIDGDLSKGYLSEDAIKTLKSCIGRDYISAEYKGKDVFRFVNKSTMIFACNDLPQNTGDNKNASFWDKLILLKFDNTDTENVKTSFKYDLIEQESLDSIFLWALDGLKRVLDNGFVFSNCKASGELKQTYKKHSSSAVSFAEENCVVGDVSSTYILSSELLEKYHIWCKSIGKIAKQADNVVSDLVEYYKIPIERKKTRFGSDTNSRYYFIGITIESEF